MELYLYIGAGTCGVIAIGLVIGAVLRGRTRSEISGTETTAVQDVAEGRRVELKGVAKHNSPLEAPYSKTPCVQYAYRLKQRERRKTSEEGRTRYQWRTIDSGSQAIPFVLADATGEIAIRPDGASFESRTFVDQYVQPGQQAGLENIESGMMKTMLQGASLLGGMTVKQKVEVTGIAVDEPVYILGEVSRDASGNLAVVEGEESMLVSAKSEEELLRAYGRQQFGFYIGAVVLAVAAIGLVVYAQTAAG